MEENNIQTTPVTTSKEGSKFGWGILGFFIPLVGFILFLAWRKDRRKASTASGIGALVGFLLGIIATVVSVILFGNFLIKQVDITTVETDMVRTAANYKVDTSSIDTSTLTTDQLLSLETAIIDATAQNFDIISNYTLDDLYSYMKEFFKDDKEELANIKNYKEFCTGYLDDGTAYVKCGINQTEGYSDKKLEDKKANKKALLTVDDITKNAGIDGGGDTPEPTPTPDTKACTGKVDNGKSKYEYKLKFYGDFDSCDTISYKLNDNFTVKLGKTDDSTYLSVYVNDVYVTGVLKGIAESNLSMYISGNTLVTNEVSTDQGANIYLINPSGEVYSVSDGQPLYTLEDGMIMKTYSVNDNGELVITGTRHDNRYGEYMGGEYLDQVEMCKTSFEMLVKTHNIPSTYDFMTNYIVELNDDGFYNLNYASKESKQTWSKFYKSKCTRLR